MKRDEAAGGVSVFCSGDHPALPRPPASPDLLFLGAVPSLGGVTTGHDSIYIPHTEHLRLCSFIRGLRVFGPLINFG